MGHKIDSFSLFILPAGKAYDVLLFNESGELVAETQVHSNDATIRLAAASRSESLEGLKAAAKTAGCQGYDVDTVEDSPFVNFRVFNNMDIRAILNDAAYSWLMSDVCPLYDRPDLQIVDDIFILQADGIRVGGPSSRNADRAGAAGSPRPKSRKIKIDQIWF